MSSYTIYNATTATVIARNALIANTFWHRMRGLIGRQLGEGQALIIPSCQWVHSVGMQYPIDVVFIDRNSFILSLIHTMKPNRISPFIWGATQVIELPAGTLSATRSLKGHQLAIIPPKNPSIEP